MVSSWQFTKKRSLVFRASIRIAFIGFLGGALGSENSSNTSIKRAWQIPVKPQELELATAFQSGSMVRRGRLLRKEPLPYRRELERQHAKASAQKQSSLLQRSQGQNTIGIDTSARARVHFRSRAMIKGGRTASRHSHVRPQSLHRATSVKQYYSNENDERGRRRVSDDVDVDEKSTAELELQDDEQQQDDGGHREILEKLRLLRHIRELKRKLADEHGESIQTSRGDSSNESDTDIGDGTRRKSDASYMKGRNAAKSSTDNGPSRATRDSSEGIGNALIAESGGVERQSATNQALSLTDDVANVLGDDDQDDVASADTTSLPGTAEELFDESDAVDSNHIERAEDEEWDDAFHEQKEEDTAPLFTVGAQSSAIKALQEDVKELKDLVLKRTRSDQTGLKGSSARDENPFGKRDRRDARQADAISELRHEFAQLRQDLTSKFHIQQASALVDASNGATVQNRPQLLHQSQVQQGLQAPQRWFGGGSDTSRDQSTSTPYPGPSPLIDAALAKPKITSVSESLHLAEHELDEVGKRRMVELEANIARLRQEAAKETALSFIELGHEHTTRDEPSFLGKRNFGNAGECEPPAVASKLNMAPYIECLGGQCENAHSSFIRGLLGNSVHSCETLIRHHNGDCDFDLSTAYPDIPDRTPIAWLCSKLCAKACPTFLVRGVAADNE